MRLYAQITNENGKTVGKGANDTISFDVKNESKENIIEAKIEMMGDDVLFSGYIIQPGKRRSESFFSHTIFSGCNGKHETKEEIFECSECSKLLDK